jgi:hypothetical protein
VVFAVVLTGARHPFQQVLQVSWMVQILLFVWNGTSILHGKEYDM